MIMVAATKVKSKHFPVDPLHSLFNSDFDIDLDSLDLKLLIEEILDLESSCLTIDHYDELVGHLKSSQLDFILTGIRLHLIQKHKLYIKHYKYFKDFCKYELHRSPHTTRLNVIAADVCVQLIGLGYTQLPHNPSQANAIYDAVTEDLPIGLVWQRCLDTYEPWQLTTKKINELFNPPADFIEPENKFVMLPWSLYQRLAELAFKKRKSIIDYLEYITERSTKVENYCLLKLLLWSG